MALLLGSCARIQRDTSQMTPEQMLQRSTHVFIGVMEKHEFPSRLLLWVSGEDAGRWRVIDMRVAQISFSSSGGVPGSSWSVTQPSQ